MIDSLDTAALWCYCQRRYNENEICQVWMLISLACQNSLYIIKEEETESERVISLANSINVYFTQVNAFTISYTITRSFL
jgi:hypothetical protein